MRTHVSQCTRIDAEETHIKPRLTAYIPGFLRERVWEDGARSVRIPEQDTRADWPECITQHHQIHTLWTVEHYVDALAVRSGM